MDETLTYADADAGVRALLGVVLETARAQLGEGLESAYAIGSLGHGGFVREVSDLDVALTVDAQLTPDTQLGSRIAAAVRARTGDPLALRLSVFWCDWGRLAAGDYGAGRFPAPDRLDLAQAGRHLLGPERRATVAVPEPAELVTAAAEFALAKLDGSQLAGWLRAPQKLAASDVRTITKAALFPVRFLYTAASGRVGSNDDAAAWYASERLAGHELAVAAAAWRSEGLPEPERCAELLAQGLGPVHETFCEQYAARLDALDRRDLADGLRALRETLR